MDQVEKLQEAVNVHDNERIISVLDDLAVKLRDASLRGPFGDSLLPTILVDLAKSEDHEILRQTGRVAANLIIDNDQNRSKLVESGYIDTVLALPVLPAPVTLPIVASLHNLVVDGHEPSIASLQQPLNTRAIQSMTRTWTDAFYNTFNTTEPIAPEVPTITQWLWAILALVAASKPTSVSIAPNLITIPLFKTNTPSATQHIDATDSAHWAILSSACGIIETSESLELVEGNLEVLLDFVEHADMPQKSESGSGSGTYAEGVVVAGNKAELGTREGAEEEEEEEEEEETEAEEDEEEEDEEEEDFGKVLGSSKAAIIRALVSHSSDLPASSPYWIRMRAWLENEKSSVIGGERVDLLNCALLSFGNSIRDDASATILLPTILPDILPLLVPSAPGTTQHSLIGLLKNLSIPTPNKVLLGDAGVIERLYNMRVFGEERDLLGSVQGGAAGILKNLCKGNVVNTLRLLSLSLDNEDEVSSPNQDQNEDNDQDQDEDQKQQQTPQTRTKGSLEPILALIKRTDDPALRFECTRIFVNIIKSLAAPVPATPTQQPKLSPQPAPASIPSSRLSHTIQPMVHMLRDAGEYPVLQQEAVIALTLLATFWPDTKTAVSEALKPHLQILQNMTQSDRREIRENASTLLRQTDQTQTEIEHA